MPPKRIYLQNVNIVALVNSKKNTFFPNDSKPGFIQFPIQIYIQIAFNVMEF